MFHSLLSGFHFPFKAFANQNGPIPDAQRSSELAVILKARDLIIVQGNIRPAAYLTATKVNSLYCHKDTNPT